MDSWGKSNPGAGLPPQQGLGVTHPIPDPKGVLWILATRVNQLPWVSLWVNGSTLEITWGQGSTWSGSQHSTCLCLCSLHLPLPCSDVPAAQKLSPSPALSSFSTQLLDLPGPPVSLAPLGSSPPCRGGAKYRGYSQQSALPFSSVSLCFLVKTCIGGSLTPVYPDFT